MITLRELNEKFCLGALEIWYIHRIEERNVFTKKIPRMFDPMRHGVMRTIRYKAPGQYLLVMDIDGDVLTQNVLDAARCIYENCKEDEKPLLKDSGNKGIHLIWKVIFPKPMDEGQSVSRLGHLAWEYYTQFGIEDYGINFGPPGTDIPHVDTSMFQRNRKVRGFCTRFDGNFSVPLLPKDDVKTAANRRRLCDFLPDVAFGTIIFSEDLLKTEKPLYLSCRSDDISSVDPCSTGIPVDHEVLFKRLPAYLRSTVKYSGDIHHNEKRWLVWYLFRMGYDDRQVFDFIWNCCKWSDLNNKEITQKQIVSLRKTYDNIVGESGAFTFPDFIMD